MVLTNEHSDPTFAGIYHSLKPHKTIRLAGFHFRPLLRPPYAHWLKESISNLIRLTCTRQSRNFTVSTYHVLRFRPWLVSIGRTSNSCSVQFSVKRGSRQKTPPLYLAKFIGEGTVQHSMAKT